MLEKDGNDARDSKDGDDKEEEVSRDDTLPAARRMQDYHESDTESSDCPIEADEEESSSGDESASSNESNEGSNA